MKKLLPFLTFLICCNSATEDAPQEASVSTTAVTAIAPQQIEIKEDTILTSIKNNFERLYDGAYKNTIYPCPSGFKSWDRYAIYAKKYLSEKGYVTSTDTVSVANKGHVPSIYAAKIIKHTQESNPEQASLFWNHNFNKKYDIYYCEPFFIKPLMLWATSLALKEKAHTNLGMSGFTDPKELYILLFNDPADASEIAFRSKLNEFGNIIFDKEIKIFLQKGHVLSLDMKMQHLKATLSMDMDKVSELASSINEAVGVTDFAEFIHTILETPVEQYEGQVDFFRTLALEHLYAKGFKVRPNITDSEIAHMLLQHADRTELAVLVKANIVRLRSLLVVE